eukprot:gnl/Hemi2/11419_TR3957_c0_g1_i1.p1 gnl/Hemi2/11419_TR3957_c0_g1~~gnl/Hemi2/11419_TR3957_c0_g1_i1.p1  ORF type:complete len:371 (+),score=141.02 gnl/Hemi2/11419_TR3957_c0_g1_i1:47-1114(+)
MESVVAAVKRVYARILAMDRDEKDLAYSTAMSVVKAFRAIMSTMLVVFVPLNCAATYDLPAAECSIAETLSSSNPFKRLALVLNAASLATVIYTHLRIYIREQYIIEWFDEDKRVPEQNLELPLHADSQQVYLDFYPQQRDHLLSHNRAVSNIAYTSLVLLVGNFVLSLLICFRDSMGLRTYTVLLTNASLLIGELFYSYTICNESALANSCYSFQPVAYNVIDSDHLDETAEAAIKKIIADHHEAEGHAAHLLKSWSVKAASSGLRSRGPAKGASNLGAFAAAAAAGGSLPDSAPVEEPTVVVPPVEAKALPKVSSGGSMVEVAAPNAAAIVESAGGASLVDDYDTCSSSEVPE